MSRQWWTGRTPLAEWFAEGYSWCARHAHSVSNERYAIYQYRPTVSQHARTCSLIKDAACALATGAVLRLPARYVLAGAALAGLPSLATVFAGVHWLGAPFCVALFAVWCGRPAARRSHPATPAAP